MPSPLLIIGLDGATWPVLDKLIDAGHMPALKKLLEKSIRGPLRSTVPPATFPAW
ncbi:alkaline phosphatase family protein, partial [Myxococcota bacterium]|nr:alkaline phosphatase family protein [Myxococcota bacterium]